MTVGALELFPRCILPGCPRPAAEQGHPCLDCTRAFTGYLQTTDTAPLTQAEQHDRDQHTRTAQRAQRSVAAAAAIADATGQLLTRHNQRCWLCEQSRKCTRISGQWECRTCQTVT